MGITPAYAGKRDDKQTCTTTRKDHPRVCGEKASLNALIAVPSGSPPRMRGKAAITARRVPAARITPAYAGKSFFRLLVFHRPWDHPRVCGEKPGFPQVGEFVSGSPPRMRGKVEFLLDFTRQFRITPAYAGKRCSLMLSRILMRDHPRVCGEKREIRQPPAALRGSPPRMRGKGLQVVSAHEKQGITPAYAGKSGAFFGRVAVQPDHPRVCGEKTKKIP